MFQRIGRARGMATLSRTGTYVCATTGGAPSSMDPAPLQPSFAKQ